MNNNEILEKVKEIFRDILDNDEIELTFETSANDVEDWDSLTHIQLIVAIEKSLKIKFTSKEILSWSNVGEMIECIQTKKSA
ncbi:acyl carrier protein [Pedobacter cryotolerans]|uniref:Acyl carrier protein n=1 Tax=Pedobacter cryotolerans TaxID=2571270 RepID=A0A4U1C309_9SPHI|nr:acyl carrier protein [Pedobacter cryotolerans]TKB99655.1 acyl carrier protein [Pedobacter cryotolerans]